MLRTRPMLRACGWLVGAALLSGCALWRPMEPPPERSLVVTATAYNSVVSQTDGSPSHGAWGDRLRPGTRAIAVSQDLLALGLERGVTVRIEGLPGRYVVLDRMGNRWRRRIDVYMGQDVRKARQWGRRQVRIYWTPRPRSN